MSGKKEEKVENSEGSYEVDEDVSDQEIEDDGEVSSEHSSSIDLNEYLRHRDAIPDDPSDQEDDEESEEEFQDDEEEDEEEESSQKKPKPSKRATLAAKKKQKQESAKKEKE